jgi:hypothetical protein
MVSEIESQNLTRICKNKRGRSNKFTYSRMVGNAEVERELRVGSEWLVIQEGVATLTASGVADS